MPETSAAKQFTQVPMLPGHFHFADVHTTAVDAARAFYAGRSCWITDPQGTYVALMTPMPPAR